MAFEILNNSVVTPPRLHAMVRLTSRLRTPVRQELYDLLQPSFALPKLKDQGTAKDVYTAARSCGLLAENDEKIVAVQVDPHSIERLEDFRRHMQRSILGVIDDSADNYLLNIYSAWYAVQSDRVFQFALKDFETRFNSEIFPDAEGRQFNTTKLNGWRSWAAFLGLGWPIRFSNREPSLVGGSRSRSIPPGGVNTLATPEDPAEDPSKDQGSLDARRVKPILIVPDSHDRLEPLLEMLLPDGEQQVLFGTFMDLLAEHCPELDGGVLFNRCWQASRGSEQRGNRLSLMLSSGLRVLHEVGAIHLDLVADAAVKWQLYPALGHPISQVSHIRRRRTA